MKTLLQSVQIVDPFSTFHLQRKNILFENGKICQITDLNPEADEIIDCVSYSLSAGWFDMRCYVTAGQEHKEDFESASRAAQAGGFTELAILPNTNPVLQSRESLRYVQNISKNLPVRFYPIAAVSLNCEGNEMTEMIDLHEAGAVAFSDGLNPINNNKLIINTLEYLQPLSQKLILWAMDKKLSQNGQMHEGIESTYLGLKGMPTIAEKIAIRTALELLDYAGGTIHFTCISSAEAVDLIRQAKAEGKNITADIAAYHLAFTDVDLKDFDTNLKVNPPLRTETDRKALLEGLADGTIDAVVSGHIPQDTESKRLEYDLAEFGMIGLETTFASLQTFGKMELSLTQIVEKLAINPRKILNLPIPKIAEGEKLNFTLFAPDHEWIFTENDIFSKSRNTPFVGKKLEGKVIRTFFSQ